MRGHTAELCSVGFSPDGRWLASASGDGTVKLWDVTTGQEIRTLRGHTRAVTCVVFSPDGQQLASASYDKTLKLWNLMTGEQVHTLRGHTDAVLGIAFSPDGRRLASTGRDMSVKLWDTVSGHETLSLTTAPIWGYSVAFSPDGRTLACSSTHVWDTAATDGKTQSLADFVASSNEIVAWHRREAKDCLKAEQWFAAIFHLTRLIAAEPGNGQSLRDRARAYAGLGQRDKALADYTQALELEAAVQYARAKAFYGIGQCDGSAQQFAKERAYRELRLGPEYPDTLECILNHTDALEGTVRRPEMVALCEAALQRTKAQLDDNHPLTLHAMEHLACAYHNVGRGQESVALFEETCRLARAKLGPDDPRTLQSLDNLAMAYGERGRFAEAVSLREDVLRAKKSKLGPNHPETIATEYWLASLYLNWGRLDKALSLSEQNYQHVKDTLGSDHPLTLRSMYQFAKALQRNGREKEALPLQEEAWRLSTAQLGPDHRDTLYYLTGLAHSYFLAKEPENAMTLYDEYLLQLRKHELHEAWVASHRTAFFGHTLLQFGKFPEAEKLLRTSLAIREKTEPDLWTTFHNQSLLGGALLGQSDESAAEPLLLSGYEGMKQREAKIPAHSRKYLIEALERLVHLYDGWGRKDKAPKWKDKASEWKKKLDEAKSAVNAPAKPSGPENSVSG